MANPTPQQPEAPGPWYGGLIGFVIAALVLGSAGLATAASYDDNDSHDDDHGSEHSEDEDHSEDE